MLPMHKIDASANLFFVNSCNKYVDTPIEKAPKKLWLIDLNDICLTNHILMH